MGIIEDWKSAKSPNYETNKDQLYPYSELPYLGQYKLVKIPVCVNNLIKHVDYLGEGRIETELGIKGFYDCYNVNYQYNLVKADPDKGRKIPNRIPMSRDDECRTRCYIKDNSVLTVTCAIHLSDNSVYDVARIVNSDWGKVILYGHDDENAEFVSEELKKTKQLFYCPIYLLPEHLQLSYYKTCYRAYLSLNELKKELFNYVNKGDYEAAMILTECLNNVYCCTALGDVVNKLLDNKDTHVMVYAYKLWINNAKDIVCKHFPAAFKLILNGDCLMIINKKYNQAMQLYGNGEVKSAWGDNHHKTNDILSWKVIPIWENDNIIFKLHNVDSNMYLQLASNAKENGDREVCGSNNSKELQYNFCLEPLLVNGEIAFTILNCEYGQRLKLADDIDSDGDRCVLGQATVVSDQGELCMWILAPCKQLVGNDMCKQSSHCQCIDINNSI